MASVVIAEAAMAIVVALLGVLLFRFAAWQLELHCDNEALGKCCSVGPDDNESTAAPSSGCPSDVESTDSDLDDWSSSGFRCSGCRRVMELLQEIHMRNDLPFCSHACRGSYAYCSARSGPALRRTASCMSLSDSLVGLDLLCSEGDD